MRASSRLAWRVIPFLRNKSFVGRERPRAELEAKLFSDKQTTTRLAIVGLGGIGKSQLALEVAYRTKLNYKNCSVFWIDASDKDSLYQSYAGVAHKLGIPGCDEDQANTDQVIKRCVAEMSMRQCLLIFDNIDTTAVLSNGSLSTSSATTSAYFLPYSKLCSVIFTTTQSDVAETLAPQCIVALHNLTPDTALKMLQNRLSRPLSNTAQQQAVHLLRDILCLPLTIVQAAAYIKVSNATVQQYRAQLAEHKEAISSDEPSGRELRESDVTDAVAATLSLSMSQIRKSNATAADYLLLAACVDRKDIPLDLLEAASLQAREDAIRVLDRYALVIRRPADEAIDVHRLVHFAIRKRLHLEGRLQAETQRTIAQLLRMFPNQNCTNRAKWRRLVPHARDVLSLSQNDDDKERLDLAWRCAMALDSDARYKAAEQLFVQVMEARKRIFGNDHPDTLLSMSNVAVTYSHQGRLREAEELNVQVTDTRRRVLGVEHPDTLLSTSNLAATYRNQGRWREAGDLNMQVIKIRKESLAMSTLTRSLACTT